MRADRLKTSSLAASVGLIVVMLLALSSATATAGPVGARQAKTVRVVVTPGFAVPLPLYVAQRRGFFKRNGLDVKISATGNTLTPVLTGAADVGVVSPSVTMNAVSQGYKLKVLFALGDRTLQQIVVRPDLELRSPTNSWPGVIRELKGLTIGVGQPGSSLDINLRYLLKTAGLNPSTDVRIIALGTVPLVATALRAKRIDAAIMTETTVYQMLRAKEARLALDLINGHGPAIMKQPFITPFTTDAFASKNLRTLLAFRKAVQDALNWMANKKNRQAAANIARRNINPTLTQAEASFVVARVVQTEKNLCFTAGDYQKVAEVLTVGADLISAELPPASALVRMDLQPGCRR